MATKMNWDRQKIVDVIEEARNAGRLSAQKKLNELRNAGPKFAVTDGERVVDTMLDVCGFAHLSINARGKFYLLAKKISKENRQYRFHCDRDSYNGGGWLSIYDSTMRQEMSVKIAACKGQQEVLLKYGIESRIKSWID